MRAVPVAALALALLCGCGSAGAGGQAAPVMSRPAANPPAAAATAAAADPMRFWDERRAGANTFDHVPTRERFEAARGFGIEFVRVAPNKWETEARDFLIGDADRFDGLVAADLARLIEVLDWAQAAGLRVVLTTLSLPGARWRQQNGDQADLRLYEDESYVAQSERFWGELAAALRGHPAIVGYNVVNEPISRDALRVGALYERIVAAIRAVDPVTPIVLDVPDEASPVGIADLEAIDDPRVLYSVHFYEPWDLVTWRENRNVTAYPAEAWNRDTLANALAPVFAWQQAHRVPARRILVGEVGCDRRIPGVERYLADSLSLFEEQGWHWAFYSFREDTWPGMDYELGTYELRPEQWDAIDRGEAPSLPRGPNPIFDVILAAIARTR